MRAARDEDDSEDGNVADDAGWRMDELRNGRRLLWAALFGSVLMLLALMGKSTFTMVVFMMSWAVSLLAGLSGISKVARTLESGVLVKYGSLVLMFMPLLALLPLVYHLVRVQNAMSAAAQEERRARSASRARERSRRAAAGAASPSAARPVPAPAPRVHAAAPAASGAAQRIARAVAMVKHAGLDGVPDGQRIRVSLSQAGTQLPPGQEPVARAAKGTFGVMYAIDEGQHFSYVNLGEMEAAGMSVEDLHRVGLRNLAARVNDGKPGLTLVPQGSFHALVMGGDYEASLVLIDELWDGSLKQYTPNRPVVTVPARDMCAFCDAASAEGIRQLRTVAQQTTQGGQGLVSDKLLVRKAGNWQEFTDPGRPELAPLEFKL